MSDRTEIRATGLETDSNAVESIAVESITVTVKLFAVYQEVYGTPELILQFPAGATVGQVRDRLLNEQPQLERWRELTRFGVNFQFVEPDQVLQGGDEVVLIPPVSGG